MRPDQQLCENKSCIWYGLHHAPPHSRLLDGGRDKARVINSWALSQQTAIRTVMTGKT